METVTFLELKRIPLVKVRKAPKKKVAKSTTSETLTRIDFVKKAST